MFDLFLQLLADNEILLKSDRPTESNFLAATSNFLLWSVILTRFLIVMCFPQTSENLSANVMCLVEILYE